MYGNVYGRDGEFVGSVNGDDFRDRKGQRIGHVRDGNLFTDDGAFVCGVQKAELALPRDSLSSGEFASLVGAR